MDKREATDDTTQFWRTAAILTAALLAVLSVGAVTAGPGTDATTVTGCDTIDSAGSYELTTDVTNSTLDSCINVTASNVIFDGQGHRIDGDGTGSGELGINVTGSSTLSNVTIRNVTVTDWYDGVEYDGVVGGLITGVTAVDNEDEGIQIDRSDGIDVAASNASGNGDVGLVFFLLSDAANVTDTVANNNGDIGFSATDSFTFRNNTAIDNYGSGFDLASDNTLIDNTARNNGYYGFDVGNDNTLVNTTAIGNFGAFWGASNNTVENLNLGPSTAPNTTIDFTAEDIYLKSVDAPPPDPGDRNIGRYVEVENTSENAFLNITFHYEEGDVANVNESKLDIWKHNDTWTELGVDAHDTDANEIRYSTTNVGNPRVNVGSYFAPLVNTSDDFNGIDRCREINPSTVPADRVVNLTASITDSSAGSCVLITTDNVTFDGQGHTIDGVKAYNSFGVLVRGDTTLSNVTVRNVTVTGWDWGVEYEDVNGGLITGVTATDNSDDGGISITGQSTGIDIVATNSSGNDGTGVSLSDSVDGTVTDTVASNNRFAGFSGGSSYTFRNDTATDNGYAGFTIGNDNTLENNTAIDNSNWEFEGNSNNSVENLDIGASTASNTTLSFRATDVRLTSVESPPPDPGGEQNIGRFVEAENTSQNASLDVTFQYEDSDVANVDESRLDVWKYSRNWTELGTDARDTTANEIRYSVSDFGSVFAPLANTSTGGGLAISGCREINASNAPANGVVRLTSPITDSTASSCVEITTGDIVFDGQGHTIDGDGTGAGDTGVNVTGSGPLSNVTVRDVTLTDWDEGVSYDDVSDGLVAGITATDNGGSGVGIGAGIEIEDSTGVDVRASNLSGNQFALALIGSSNGNVTDTIANNNDEDAFFGGDSYTFRNNTANANANSGFEIDNDNRLYNNTVIDNGRIGLNVGNDNLLVNTTAIDNEGEEFFGDVNNTARNFDVGASTAPNTTLSFAATNVVIEGVSSPPPDPGTERNIGRYVRAEKRAGSPASQFNVTFQFQYEDSDVANVDEANLSVWKYNDSWSELGSDSRDAGANEIRYNFSAVPEPTILAPLATTGGTLDNIANCREITPDSVPADGLVNLTADITDSPATTCIQISTDEVTFDGQGHRIDGDGSGLDSGILVSDGSTLSNVTVRNATVTGWAAGVEYEDVDGGLVTEVTATDNDGDGINVGSSIGVDVAAVNASGNDGDGVSFFSGSSSGGSVTDTVVANNGANGFQGGDSYTFRNTTVVGNGNGGFAAGDNNTIVGTTITDTGGDGISAGNDNRIVNNTVRNNTGSGFFIDDDNTLINNTARNNTGNGFVAINDNTLVNNTAIDNGGSDVWVFANNTVENLDLGASTAPDTTIDFTATDVRLGSVRSPPSDPDGEQNIGRFINATNTSQDAFLDVTFEYEDSDVTDLNESTLSVWQYEDTWSELGADDHDTGANEIRFNVSSFSTFGVFGESDGCLSYLRSIANGGQINTLALLTAIDDWRDNQIGTPCLFDAIDYWRNDTPV